MGSNPATPTRSGAIIGRRRRMCRVRARRCGAGRVSVSVRIAPLENNPVNV
ncbi:hypothetical protein ACFPM0_00460 [Pseudonocardia sulfidoxydans]|uniref:hypothetical protein n=1 Tax=Pseudonocardia sulfidoxydans TaxID=54011 RepID=UPI00360F3EAA